MADKVIFYPLFFLALLAAAGVYLAYHALGWVGNRLRRMAFWLSLRMV